MLFMENLKVSKNQASMRKEIDISTRPMKLKVDDSVL